MGAGASVRRGMVFGVSLAIIALRRANEVEDDVDDHDADDMEMEIEADDADDYDYEIDEEMNWIASSTESD